MPRCGIHQGSKLPLNCRLKAHFTLTLRVMFIVVNSTLTEMCNSNKTAVPLLFVSKV